MELIKNCGIWLAKLWSRTRLFTYEEWCGLIDKVNDKEVPDWANKVRKKIKTRSMEVTFEYDKNDKKKETGEEMIE